MNEIGGVKVHSYVYKYTDKNGIEMEDTASYIDIREIPKKWQKEFDNWMRGQTFPLVEGKGNNAVYPHDWERWYNMKTRDIPTYWD